LGATLPLDGYGLVNLSLSEDGKVLIGQLKGTYSGNILSEESLSQKPSQSHVWDVKALIAAALAQPSQDRLRKHISLTSTPNAEQSIANLGSEFKGTIGTAFDPEWIVGSVEGNMGDVIGVDLKELAARQLLLREGILTEANVKTPLAKLSSLDKAFVTTRMLELSDFSLDPQQLDFFAGRISGENPALKLLTKNANTPVINPTLVSRKSADASHTLSTVDADFKETGILFFVPNITDNSITPKSVALSDKERLLAGEKLNDKFAQLIFYYKDKSQPLISVNLQPEEAHGIVTVTAKDYAGMGAFVGDRPLDNPGYTKFLLKGGVDTTATDLLDVTRVEQRLKYLGFSAVDTTTGKPNQEIIVDGRFNSNEQQALKLFETIVRYTTAIGTGQGVYGNASVEIQYKATVTASGTVELKEVPNSFKQLPTANTPTFIESNGALLIAIDLAKQNALIAAGFKSAAETKAMDGKIEADLANTQRKITLAWLNAYNAPHWMQFFASTGSTYATTNTKLGVTAWTNHAENGNVFGTNWVFDLMTLSGKTAGIQGRTKALQYAGSGDLGTTLELGINTQYISQTNQKQINGNEWLLGLSDVNSVDLKNVTANNAASATPQEKLKDLLQQKAQLALQSNGQWNYTVANSLADLLKETNRAPVAGMSDIGNANSNRQDEALKDFLAVYAATLNDSVNGNGSLDEQINNITSATSNADKIKIQQALFGKGGNGAGLIDSQNIILGGKGLGAKLDIDSLAAIMNISKDEAAGWVDVLNQVLSSADINTPQRLSMFLANAAQETGQLRWPFEGGNVNPINENVTYNYTETRYGLNSPNGPSNGNTSVGDGSKYRGRGLLHITWKYNYEIATFGYSSTVNPSNKYTSYNEWQGTQQILNTTSTGNPDGTVTVTGTIPPGWSVRIEFPKNGSDLQEFGYFVDTNNTGVYTVTSKNKRAASNVTGLAVKYDFIDNAKQISDNKLLGAQIGAWYWRFERVNASAPNPLAWDLNSRAADVNKFIETVVKINKGELKLNSDGSEKDNYIQRKEKYSTAKKAVDDENSYGSMNELLKGLGISTVNEAGYNKKFGISLNKRIAVEIDGANNLLADEVVENSAVIQQDLMQTLQSQFDIEQGDDMLLLAMADVPPIPVSEIALVAVAPTNSVKTLNYGVCSLAEENTKGHAEFDLNIYGFLVDFLPKELKQGFGDNSLNPDQSNVVFDWMDSITIKRLQEPEHGVMSNKAQYLPNEGYIGKDRVVLLLEGNDLDGHPFSIKLNYYINVMPESEWHHAMLNRKDYQQALKKYCGTTRRLSENRNEKLFSPNTISSNFDAEPEKLPLFFISN